MTNESRCILAKYCKAAGSTSCTNQCPHYISVHGVNGDGGRVGMAGTPKDYKLLTLTNSPAREGQPAVYALLDDYVKTFNRQFEEGGARIKSLYLYSKSPGTGKTTTAVALMNEWIIVNYLGSLKRGITPTQRPAYFLDVNEFQSRYNLATMTGNESELDAIRNEIRCCQTVPFLVMDDIGVRGASDAFRSYLHSIINHRATHSLPTVYTSNIPLERRERGDEHLKTFAEVFDERLYDRVRDQCAEIRFDGKSKRGRR